MKKIVFILAIFVVFPIVRCHAQQPAFVKVDNGLLQGAFEDGITVYRISHLQHRQLVNCVGVLLSPFRNGMEYVQPGSLPLLPYRQEIRMVEKVKIAST